MRVVFLDRDGVINENRDDHVKSWEEFCFLPTTFEALRMLRAAGYLVFVVTNQAIISRGLASRQTLDDIHTQMIAQITTHGGRIHDLRFCPHDKDDNCTCRKPQPGMLLDLASRWRIDLTQATMVGDAWTDIRAAKTVGCRAVLVKTGRGVEQLGQLELQQNPPNYIAANLLEAVTWLCRNEEVALPIDDRRVLRRYGATAVTIPGE
jgi:D-glycero-D-manno-heptose 1,7-bisphosphate phosphatase